LICWQRRIFCNAGGEDILSEGRRALIRRAAMLEVKLEMLLETKFANNEGISVLPRFQRNYRWQDRTANSHQRCFGCVER
jgi:hypothetical protein